MLAALALAAILAAQPPSPVNEPAVDPGFSLVPRGVTEKISGHVWAIPDLQRSMVPNVGIIVGKKAVLVVDTGMGAANAQSILAEVAKVADPRWPIYIVSTHYHPEHDLGAHAFPPNSKMIRSTDQEKDIAQYGLTLANTFAQRSMRNMELLKDVKYRPADVRFDKTYDLDLGGVTARIVAQGPNHTRGDTVVVIKDGSKTVLFSGDIVMRGQPAFAAPESSIAHWLMSLDALEATKPTDIIPAHGKRGGPEMISNYKTYLTRIRDRSAALKTEGKSQADTVTQVTAEMPDYPDKGRLAGAIRNAWTEAK